MHFSVLRQKVAALGFDRFLAVFLLADVCLLPYLRFLSALPSMLILMIWYAVSIRKKRFSLKFSNCDTELWAFVLICVLAAASCLLGLIILPSTVFSPFQNSELSIFRQSVVYSAIFVFVFLYYFCCREVYKKYHALAYATIKIVFVAMFLFSLIYLISPVLFYSLRTFWTLDGTPMDVTDESIQYYRYTFSFSDPNNLSMMAIAITVLIAENKQERLPVRLAVFPMCFLIMLETMSVQGILSMLVYLAIKGCSFVHLIATGQIKLQKRTISIILISSIVALVLFILLAQTSVVSSALSRLLGNSNSLSIRLSIWSRLLKEKGLLPYVLLGNGCTVVLNGQELMPHNGHLYLIYAYGGIAYLLFMYVFFRKTKGMRWQDMLFVIPLFLCFSINVGLIDARFSFMLAQIIALGRALSSPQANTSFPVFPQEKK